MTAEMRSFQKQNGLQEEIRNLIQRIPKSQWSIYASVFAHLMLIVGLKNIKMETSLLPVVENYVDLGYQEFTEVPQVVQTPQVRQPAEAVETPQKAEAVPAAQEMQDQTSSVAGLQDVKPEKINLPTAASVNTTDVPYYKVKPKYPKDALASGIEGHVMIQIDIEADGSVDNIRVVGGERLNFFESEARRAVAKYRYKPFMNETGTAIKKENHMVRVEFKLMDDVAKN